MVDVAPLHANVRVGMCFQTSSYWSKGLLALLCDSDLEGIRGLTGSSNLVSRISFDEGGEL